jgi:hypothetical protein
MKRHGQQKSKGEAPVSEGMPDFLDHLLSSYLGDSAITNKFEEVETEHTKKPEAVPFYGKQNEAQAVLRRGHEEKRFTRIGGHGALFLLREVLADRGPLRDHLQHRRGKPLL